MTFGEGGEGGGEIGTEGVPAPGGSAGEGAPEGGQQQQGGEQQPQGGDFESRLMSAMENFTADVGRRFETLEGRLTPAQAAEQQQQGGPEAEPFDLAALLADLPDDAFDPETQEPTPEGYMELMRQMARAEADAVRTETQTARVQAEHDAYADELETKYSDLKDPAVQEAVFAEATALAQRAGQPALAGNPHFFETVYLASKARERAASETPAQDANPGVRLEQPGGGGGPVDNGDGPSVQQRIVAAATGSRFRIGTQG